MTDDSDKVIPYTSARPLFLAPLGRAGDPTSEDGDRLGYVTRPEMGIRHEPECVGPAILDGYGESAHFHNSLRHQQAVEAARQARPLLEAEDRIRDAERRAKASHRNLSHEFHIMRRDLNRARTGGRQDPPRVLRRLEAIEAELDGLQTAA